MKEKKRRTVEEASPAAAMVAGEGEALGLDYVFRASSLDFIFGLCFQDTQAWATICSGLSSSTDLQSYMDVLVLK
jgi:hypothetical protein